MNCAPGEPSVGDVCPKRVGLNYDPPSIIFEYLQVSTGKLFHRRIGLKRLRPNSDPTRIAEKLRQKNRALLAEETVSFDQLVSLVQRLQEGQRLPEVVAEKAPAPAEKGFDYHKTDLNKLSPEELVKHKAKMDLMFFKNQKKPGEPGFVYDVQVDFPTECQQDSGWDSEDDVDVSGGAP
mmetsp:Transcript_66541/g.187408  ORF Transcript_66541/g.187408 Transcript_66541/m.187408 type:complete len:179 (+) Transcript_66541:98-634(+)